MKIQDMKNLNPVIKNMVDRQSCRQFLPDKVTKEDLDLLLLAGSYAPSPSGRQPWAFTVITNERLLDLISDEAIRPFKERNPDAPEIPPITREGDFKRGGTVLGREGFPPLLIIISETVGPAQDSASYLAAENIMLAAKSLGLDSVVLGAITANVLKAQIEAPDGIPELKKLVPEEHHIVCTLGIGYADWNAFRAPRVGRRTDNVLFFE